MKPIRQITVTDKLSELGFQPDEQEWIHFKKLARLLSLKQGVDGWFFSGSWWRGPLLYALIRHYRPATMLEIGTWHGYGTVSMAIAAVDNGSSSTVYTVDLVPPEARVSWAIDEGYGPRVAFLSRREVWDRYVPEEVRTRIRSFSGSGEDLMRTWTRYFPPPNLIYIDGSHDYWSVTSDFLGALSICQAGAVLVFDDYGDRPGFGIKRLVDGRIVPRCPPGSLEIVDILAERYRPASFGAMEQHVVVLDTQGIDHPLAHFYGSWDARYERAVLALLKVVRRLVSPVRRIGLGVPKQGLGTHRSR